MKLYYTGVAKQGDFQLNPSSSLGGRISGTQVQSDQINNLFTDSILVQQKTYSIRSIALYNDENATIVNIQAWFDFDDENGRYKYEISFSIPGTDSCGFYLEQLGSESQNPINITWYECDGFINKVVTPTINIAQTAYFGIWIRRTTNPIAQVCEDLDAQYLANTLNTDSEVVFNLTIQSNP